MSDPAILEPLANTTADLSRLQSAMQANIKTFNAGESAGTLINNLRTASQIGFENASVAVQDGEAIGLVTIRFSAEQRSGRVRMLFAVPGQETKAVSLLVGHALDRVWAEPGIEFLNATLFADQPGVREAFAEKGALAVPRAEMRITDLSAFTQDILPPEGFRFAALSGDVIDAAAQVTVAAFKGTIDDQLDPHMQTVEGMQRTLRAYLADSREVFDAEASAVIYHDAALVGLIVCTSTPEKRGYIKDVNVAPEWRRKGVARALMGHALHALAVKEAPGAKLWVTLENPARLLYESLGFTVYSPMWVYIATRPPEAPQAET